MSRMYSGFSLYGAAEEFLRFFSVDNDATHELIFAYYYFKVDVLCNGNETFFKNWTVSMYEKCH